MSEYASFSRNHTRNVMGTPRHPEQLTALSPRQGDLSPGPCCVQFPPSIASQTSRGKAHGAKSVEQNHPGVWSTTKRPKYLDKPLQSKKSTVSNPQLHGLVKAALPVPRSSIKLGSTGFLWRIPASFRPGRQMGSLAFFNFAQTLL